MNTCTRAGHRAAKKTADSRNDCTAAALTPTPRNPAPNDKLSKGKPIDMQPDREPKKTTDHKNSPDPSDQENRLGEPGAEGGSHSDAKDKLPGAPSDDDSPVGDTDQHSNA